MLFLLCFFPVLNTILLPPCLFSHTVSLFLKSVNTFTKLQYSWAFLVAQLVKNPPTMQETWVRSLGWEDPWRRERLPNPVFWPGEFHGLYKTWGCKELDTTEQLSLSQCYWSVVLCKYGLVGASSWTILSVDFECI